jgi:hypothetical protein
MKRTFFLCLPLFLILLSSYAPSQTVTPPNREQDEKGIKQVLTGFVEAWNRHDAKAFSMLFAEDADFTNVRGMSAHGRTEVEKMHAPRFATNFKDSHQTRLLVNPARDRLGSCHSLSGTNVQSHQVG